eukprot:761247-Hanusia_phi.AAC.5
MTGCQNLERDYHRSFDFYKVAAQEDAEAQLAMATLILDHNITNGRKIEDKKISLQQDVIDEYLMEEAQEEISKNSVSEEEKFGLRSPRKRQRQLQTCKPDLSRGVQGQGWNAGAPRVEVSGRRGAASLDLPRKDPSSRGEASASKEVLETCSSPWRRGGHRRVGQDVRTRGRRTKEGEGRPEAAEEGSEERKRGSSKHAGDVLCPRRRAQGQDQVHQVGNLCFPLPPLLTHV